MEGDKLEKRLGIMNVFSILLIIMVLQIIER